MNEHIVHKVQSGFIDNYYYKDNNQIMEDYSNLYEYFDNILDSNDYNQIANYYGGIYNRDFYKDLDSLLYDNNDDSDIMDNYYNQYENLRDLMYNYLLFEEMMFGKVNDGDSEKIEDKKSMTMRCINIRSERHSLPLRNLLYTYG